MNQVDEWVTELDRELLVRWSWDVPICGCANPEWFWEDLFELLKILDKPNEDWERRTRELDVFKDAHGERYLQLMLYFMDADTMKLTHHGGSVWGSWLSRRGEDVVKMIRECGMACLESGELSEDYDQVTVRYERWLEETAR